MSFNDQVITGSISLGADTYDEDEILLPQMPRGVLPAFLRVEIQIPTAAFDADTDYFGWHISPKSQDAVLNIGDQEAIAAGYQDLLGALAAGVHHGNLVFSYDFPAPMLVSFTKLFFGAIAKTNPTVLAYRIHWVPRSSKVPQRDNVVSQTMF